MKTPLAVTLSLFLSLGSISGVVNQMRPPVQSDFGGGGLQSPIYVNGVTGECYVYVNGTITPINNSINVKAFGAKGDFVTDDTAAIQAAVTAAARGAVFFPPGTYRITAAINVKTITYIWANPYSATIYLGTQNQNGFVIGDGTAATGANVASTMIVGLQIAAPTVGVSPSASGAFILCQKANNFVIKNCSLYGLNNSGVKTGWNGIFVDRCLEWVIDGCTMNGFVNNGIRGVGANNPADWVADGRIDRCEIVSTASDGIYLGDFTAAITITDPIIYSYSGWGIKIDCTASAGVGFNYMIARPDIEASTTTSALGAVYFRQATGGEVLGGWFGGNAGAQVDSTASSIRFTGVLNQGTVPYVLSGAACSIVGGDTAGNSSTTTTGIQINAGATDTNIVGGRVRQFTVAGINFTGAPARCEVVGVNYRSNTADLTNPPSDLNSNAFPKGSSTPTPTSGTGTFTSVTGSINWTKTSDHVDMDLVVAIVTNGTAATDIRITTLPFTPAVTTPISGVVVETGKAVTGYVDTTGGGRAVILLYDGTYPGADARTIRCSVNYRV